ncbi:hypothetical protein SDC9_88856 [bioreactor metagenome]|uniref:Uncharacterized protein n=1 Tax=bioreactor metagenome TaxID=1076179 RepID=A0A644ZU64_9ZZZZ
MIIAIPDVKPVMTGMGINETKFPSLRTPAISKMTPDMKQAINTPCRPNCATRVIRIADIAPVGPDI